MRYQLWKLQRLATFQDSIRRNCDCSFLYWVTNLVPVFFQDIAESPEEVHRLQYLLAALRDCSAMLQGNNKFNDASSSNDPNAQKRTASQQTLLRNYQV